MLEMTFDCHSERNGSEMKNLLLSDAAHGAMHVGAGKPDNERATFLGYFFAAGKK